MGAVLSLAYMAAMQAAAGSFQSFQYYFDPTHPNYPIVDSSSMSLFSPDCMGATIVAIVGLVAAVIGAFMGRKTGTNRRRLYEGGWRHRRRPCR